MLLAINWNIGIAIHHMHGYPYTRKFCDDMGAKLTTEKFINKAKNIHGEVYDYSLVNYNGTKIPVEIMCRRKIFKNTIFTSISW